MWKSKLADAIATVPATDAADLIGELSRHHATALAKLVQPVNSQPAGRALTDVEVAELLSTTPRWVRAHRKELGGFGTRKLLRFPEKAVRDWIARNRA